MNNNVISLGCSHPVRRQIRRQTSLLAYDEVAHSSMYTKTKQKVLIHHLHDKKKIGVCVEPGLVWQWQRRCSGRTEGMATGQLGLLSIAGRQLVTDTVEELDIALLGVLLEGSDEGPRHGASGLEADARVGTTSTS